MWTLISGLILVAFCVTLLCYLAYIALWFKDFLKEIFVEKQIEKRPAEENNFN
jgi:hypothetical protein